MIGILVGLVLFILLGLGFWISGIFFAASIIIYMIKWGLIGVGIYLLVKEIQKILR